MTPTARKLLLTVLRVAICVGALAWVVQGLAIPDKAILRSGKEVELLELHDDDVKVRYPDGHEEDLPLYRVARDEAGNPKITFGLAKAWRDSNKAVFPLALLVFSPVTFLQSLRFLVMFRAQDIHLGYWESVKLCFLGNFLNFVAFGSTGGDVAKAYCVCLHTDRRTEAITTILLDRIIGLTGLVTVVGIIILFCTDDPLLRHIGHFIALFILAVVVGSALLVSEKARGLARAILPMRRIERLKTEADPASPVRAGRVTRALAWSVEQVGRMDATTRRLIQHKRLVVGAMLITIVLQFTVLTSYAVVVYALDMPQDGTKFWEYYAFTGIGNVAAALPITYQGIGVMEALYKKFMAGGHGSIAQVLCLVVAVRLIQLIWALPGFLVTLTGGYRPKSNDLPAH